MNETPLPGLLPRSAGGMLDNALDVLEQYGLALQKASETRAQVGLTLEAARDALGADAVVWHSSRASGEAPSQAGAGLPPGWAAQFVTRVLGGAQAGDRLVRNFLDPAARPLSPWPTSAALVRVSRSRDSWLAALSFHPRRLFGQSDLKVLLLARRMLLAHRQQLQTHERLRASLFGLVRCLTAAIDAKDPYTWGHSERVGRIAVRLGKQMALPATMLSDLYLSGLLHDIGKIGIRDNVLGKAGKLTPEEFDHIKTHTVIGDRLVSTLEPLSHLRPGVRSHHERWDGRGYPDGLAGESVPLLARVLAVADSCDAMMAARPYRSAMRPEQVDDVMRGGAGRQWDADIVAAFLACRSELYPICERGVGDSVAAAVERALNLGGTADAPSRLLQPAS